jgi:hypothetical protein
MEFMLGYNKTKQQIYTGSIRQETIRLQLTQDKKEEFIRSRIGSLEVILR